MGNAEHKHWLLKGVDSWNTRRRETHFTPDLQDQDISDMFDVPHGPVTLQLPDPVLKGINLSSANLNGAILDNLDLSYSDFTGAHLNGTSLVGSSFTDSVFFGSELNEARLGKCNLTGTKFRNTWLQSADLAEADLAGAEFMFCHLEGAKFFNANLRGTNFARSRPWKAELYYRHNENGIDLDSFLDVRLDSVNRLLDECREFRRRHGNEVVLYFRGESRCAPDWELRPSVMREARKNQKGLRPVEGELLKDLQTHEPEAFAELRSALAEWVLAQHYGLATRFLDITRNPLVALFSACSENQCEDGRLHLFAVPRSMVKSFNSDTVSVIANFCKACTMGEEPAVRQSRSRCER